MSSKTERNKQPQLRTLVTYGAFGLLILVLALYLAFRNTDRIQYKLPAVPHVDVSALSSIHIVSATDGSIKLEKKDGKWLLEPAGYEVDPDRLKKMIDAITGLTLSELVSTADYYERYELDDAHKYEITAAGDGNALLQFSIGKRSPSYNHSYVSLFGDDRVFQAPGDLRNDFSGSVESLRNKLVFTIDPETVLNVEVTTPKESFRLYRSKKDDKNVWKSNDETVWDSEALDSAFKRLVNLKCSSFIDDADLGEPVLVLKIQGEETQTLSLFAKKDSAYPAKSSQTPYTFTISSYAAEQIMKAVDRENQNGGE